ncbi:uncharacterized protein LOC123519322 isoform X2 [Portunus trituberculatus]|uniref:uncharacterized protein LOC123519322 isoform X2 n=1 Tax=Portunus trituberculatus TaxID=210409 RepID=UPI001E1CE7E6|nr:uncharacterized protein LOC123519322 isoform X2 [Portunus trituberculatus]XP_045136470.1 uncharacterized protein LOC123519322 isoform X2 [Portunus trituberculatus]XP_045136471.1 uncharacterized protein LOC123519322 isoform X2 [Portunus trituberculatus]
MHMSYYFSGTVYDFLFSGVNVVTTWGMVSLCMGLASLSLLSEGFKVARSLLLKVATSSRDTSCNRYNKSERVKFHVLQTVLHIIHLTIGYILMLAVMSYNGYFTLAVVGGAGLGYYCFALFDLPSKVLGSVTSQPAKWPGGSSLPHLSEGNSSMCCPSYGAAGSVVSPVGQRVSSQLQQGSLSMCHVGVSETSVQEGNRTQVDGASEGDKLTPSVVMCGEEDQEGLRGVSAIVDVSDRTCLLSQETIKVEVQVHAMPEE